MAERTTPSSPKVLVVDDDNYLLLLLSVALPDVDMVEATRVAQATQLLAERSFDAVIIDRRLPDGDGLELVQLIRGSERGDAELPVLVFTASHDESYRFDLMAAGADEYLSKNDEITDLAGVRSRIERLIRMSADERTARRAELVARLQAGESGDLDPLPPPRSEPAPPKRRRWLR
jgi:DNA-binding response OmpR family regulator